MQSTSCKNAGLHEAQAGVKIAGRNTNNLRFADDITLMAESEEELNSLDVPFSQFGTSLLFHVYASLTMLKTLTVKQK